MKVNQMMQKLPNNLWKKV